MGTASDRQQKALEQRRREFTIAALGWWDEAGMTRTRRLYRQAQEMRFGPNAKMEDAEFVEWMKRDNGGQEQRFAFMDIANLFETLAQIVFNEMVDENMIATGYSPLLQNIQKVYGPWISYLSESQPHIYTTYMPFHALCDKWRDRPEYPEHFDPARALRVRPRGTT